MLAAPTHRGSPGYPWAQPWPQDVRPTCADAAGCGAASWLSVPCPSCSHRLPAPAIPCQPTSHTNARTITSAVALAPLTIRGPPLSPWHVSLLLGTPGGRAGAGGSRPQASWEAGGHSDPRRPWPAAHGTGPLIRTCAELCGPGLLGRGLLIVERALVRRQHGHGHLQGDGGRQSRARCRASVGGSSARAGFRCSAVPTQASAPPAAPQATSPCCLHIPSPAQSPFVLGAPRGPSLGAAGPGAACRPLAHPGG